MTVSSEISLSGPYLCNGATKEFDYRFRIFDAGHLRVRLHDGLVPTDMFSGSDYTVTGVGNEGGGKVVMNAPPPAGKQLTITRDVPFVQETDLENQGAFYIEVIERALDEAAIRDQQLKEELGRAVVIGENVDLSAKNDLVRDITRLAAQAADISELVAMKAAIEAVRANAGNINVVAGKIGDVSAVAGIAGDVTAVKNNAVNITTVAGIAGDITTVAGIDTAAVIAARDYAYQWAAKAEDAGVNDGTNPAGYSAYHWAMKAAASAAAASNIAGGDFLPLSGGTVTGDTKIVTSNSVTGMALTVKSGSNTRAGLRIEGDTNAANYFPNGNINGTAWNEWGSLFAKAAISARIEARALAIANDRINALVNGMIDAKLNTFRASNPTFTNGVKVQGNIKATGNVEGYTTL